jgi:hypothetical protein
MGNSEFKQSLLAGQVIFTKERVACFPWLVFEKKTLGPALPSRK